MYKTDEHGEYRSVERWVRAWAGGGPYVAGFSVNELREYSDGTTRAHTGEPTYIHEKPQMGFAHGVYLMAQNEMGV